MINICHPVLCAVMAFVLTQGAASTRPLQVCGKSFAKFVVLDDQGKAVPGVTIELVGELPKLEYQKFKRAKGYVEYGGFNFNLSNSDAKDLLTKAVPIRMGTDFCGNPLMQHANLTRVESVQDVGSNRDASVHNFGYCASEGYLGVNILRISAPDHMTAYYLGTYLRGCSGGYSFVLTKPPARR